ncbi:Fpg/Nei family DNA glycosylase [Streptomyces cellulosae]|uniref:Fpg/Nei family DNA glycosylase n=1 Tax=Streptomyces cellulosae TaxID=1968 RepID=UPI0004CAFAA1|nr:DNA-formamidopyrimidine glycosylase family protein [Streptomyces cellulosae]
MPELPDVEEFRKVFASCAQGEVIRRVDVRDTGVLHGVSARRLRATLEGRRFGRPERLGKWLLARTEGTGTEGTGTDDAHTDDGPACPTVLLHFGMTGRLVCGRPDDELDPHDRVLFTVGEDRQLRYRDQRKLRGLWLADDDTAVARLLDRQGPDALTVDRKEFEAALSAHRGRVKTVLTDQSVLAGLGNLLADEILWRARLNPTCHANDLTERERHRLYTHMRRTLRSAVTAGRVPPRPSWLTGHRDDPTPACPRCHSPLRHARLSSRTTLWCPHCQPEGAG